MLQTLNIIYITALANKTISVESDANWPAVEFAPLQKVLLNKAPGSCEVAGIKLHFLTQWLCTYYLVRPGASILIEQDSSLFRADPDARSDSPDISALDQWNIKFNFGQIVRRLEDDGLYVIEGIVFKLIGWHAGRNYLIHRLEDHGKLAGFFIHEVDEMLLQESDLHL